MRIPVPKPVYTDETKPFRRGRGKTCDVTLSTHDPKYPPRALSDEALAWIVRLHSGEASNADWAGFGAWRARSAAHEAAAAEAEALWSDASELHRDAASGLIRPGRRRPVVSRRAVITGMAGIGVGAAGLWATGAFRPLSADYVTGIAETRLVDLPDGSTVTLNAMTAIDIDYSPVTRQIALVEGQAFFEIAPDTSRPFEVKVRGNAVRALGTAFDVNSNLPGGRVAVAVTEHSVRVRSAKLPPTHGGTVVSRGEGVVVAGNGAIGPVTVQDTAATAAWRTGMYVAEDRSFGDVIAALRVYRRGWIVIRDEDLKSLSVNAVLDLRAHDALETLARGLPVRIFQMSPLLTVIAQA